MTNSDPTTPPPRAERQSVAAGILPVLTSTYLAALLSLVRGIIVPRILGPTLQGVVTLANLFISYGGHSQLGLVHGLNKEMPRLLGQEDEEEANRLKDTAVTAAMLLAVIVGIGVAGYGLLFRRDLAGPTVFAIVVAGGIIVAAQAILLHQSLLRTYKQFRLIGILGVISAGLDFVLVIGLTWAAKQMAQSWAIYGTLIALLLKNAAIWLLYTLATRYRFRVSLDWGRLRRLFLSGLAIMGITFGDQFMRTADRLVIAKLLGMQALGFYAAGTMAAGLVQNIPRSVGWVLFPHFMEASGNEELRKRLNEQMLNFTLFLGAAIPALTGAIYVLTPMFLQLVLPRFIPGIEAAQGQLAGVAVMALMIPAATQLIALNQERLYIAAQIVVALATLAGGVLLVDAGGGITEIAWWRATTALAYAPGVLLMALIAYGVTWRHGITQVLISSVPLAYCGGAVLAAEYGARQLAGSDPKTLGFGLVALGLYVVAILPLMWWLDRRFGLRGRLRRKRPVPPPTAEETSEL